MAVDAGAGGGFLVLVLVLKLEARLPQLCRICNFDRAGDQKRRVRRLAEESLSCALDGGRVSASGDNLTLLNDMLGRRSTVL